MKKTIGISGLVLSLVFASAGPASAQLRFGFKLGGGLAYVGGGDVNEGLQGLSNLYTDVYTSSPGVLARGGYAPFHLGMDLNGELFLQIGPEIAVGVGAGYLSASRESSLTLTNGIDALTLGWTPKVQIVPLTLNFHYFLPAGGRVRFVLTAGVGLYLTKLELTQTYLLDRAQLKLSAIGFGAHGGVGLEIAMSPNVFFTADLVGRFAQTGGLSGELIESGSTEMNGKLWYFQISMAGLGTYPIVTYSQTAPAGADVLSPREARLGLSGFSLVFGFLFRI